jgi:sugar phosphate isomerase/epimerase
MQLSVPRALNLAGISFSDPLSPAATQPRARVEWAAVHGVRAVQLDATVPGLRPRELDRSARRDIASLLRRLELAFAGLDLSIPVSHFADPAMLDRAVKATQDAITLAADIATLSPSPSGITADAGRMVAITLPATLGADVRSTLVSHAQSCKVTLADFRWPLPELERPAPTSTGRAVHKPDGFASVVVPTASLVATSNPEFNFGCGLDTGTLLVAGLNPAKAIARLATLHPGQPAQIRLTDAAAGRRVPLGDGDLDELSVDVACQVAGYRGYAIVDLRGITGADALVRSLFDRSGN